MITGGTTTLTLILLQINLPYELDPNIFGIFVSFIAYSVVVFYEARMKMKV